MYETSRGKGCVMMGSTYLAFFGFTAIILLILPMVCYVFYRGVNNDFFMDYDYYLWSDFASNKEELAVKINKF